jgi:large subunit ribosomal protein L10
MPNEQTLNAKKAVVQALTEKLRSAAGVLIDYSGTSVAEDTEMRARLRAENVDYTVVKNTLMRFAIKNVGYDALDPVLNGTTSLAVSATDVVAPARLIKEYATKLENHFFIKGGFMDGKTLSVDEVNALASIPALPVLRAQLLGTMLAPISMLAAVIKAIAEKRDDAGQDGADAAPEAVAEAPVAEAPVAQ